MSEPCTRDHVADESDRLHGQVQRVLRVGLGLSVTLMVLGLAVTLARGEHGEAQAVRLGDLLSRDIDPGLALTASGILVLALTPAFRVLALVGLWWRERDYRFVAVALAVMATLGASVLLGKG